MDAARKAMLGQKWACFSCGTKFYDLNRPEPTCPKCEADQRESPLLAKAVKRPKGKKPEEIKPEPPPPPPPPPERVVEDDAEDADEKVTAELEQEIEDIDLDDLEITGSEDIADEDPEED
jgi:hypothetical protein